MAKIALAVHGGAGTILRSAMTPELELEYRGGLENALRVGWAILEKGGSSLDAVEATVAALEDFPLFNAGCGSVFTHEGKIEMDAAIMDGWRLRAGAVAFVRNVKNPVKLARRVMEKTEHVLLAGDGAIQFAEEMNVELADDSYFYTDHRWKQLEEAIAAGRVQLDHSTAETPRRGEKSESSPPVLGEVTGFSSPPARGGVAPVSGDEVVEAGDGIVADGVVLSDPHSAIRNPQSKGTVGAVACDTNGNLAAATSTGGMTNKKYGRVGDTAIIGAGTYAENSTCAVSCTGHGEFFMLGVIAYDLAARMKYKGLGLEDAARETIEQLTKIDGEGGLIAVDAHGNVVLPFNSEGMYRGWTTEKGEYTTQIYRL